MLGTKHSFSEGAATALNCRAISLFLLVSLSDAEVACRRVCGRLPYYINEYTAESTTGWAESGTVPEERKRAGHW